MLMLHFNNMEANTIVYEVYVMQYPHYNPTTMNFTATNEHKQHGVSKPVRNATRERHT